MKRAICGLLMLVVLFGLAGCREGAESAQGGRSRSPSASPSPSESGGEIGIPPGETRGAPTYPKGRKPTAITLTRTGGFAGVNDKLEVSAGGRWSYAGRGGDESGKLTDRQVSKLQSLALDARLRTEARHKDTRRCADGYSYSLKTSQVSMIAVQCGGFEARPAFTALVNYIRKVTPM